MRPFNGPEGSMSTTTLILIAIAICLICLASLWIVQLNRQRAIERARKTVIYTSQINQLLQIAEATAQFLDDQLIQFLANRVIYSAQKLTENKISLDKRCLHSIEQARSWLNEPKLLRKQARAGKSESLQKQLSLLKSIIQHIRQGVMDHEINRNQAKQLANATKLSKVKFSCFHYQQQASEDLKSGDLSGGMNHFKKIKSLLERISPLNNEFQALLSECDSQIDKIQNTIKEQSDNSGSQRLADEFDKLEEQEQDWQKKQLYDQW